MTVILNRVNNKTVTQLDGLTFGREKAEASETTGREHGEEGARSGRVTVTADRIG